VGILGLRLVKKTVNYDDPGTFHLYYGDRNGTPGTILTFFPWTSSAARGKPGLGQVVSVAFSVPRGSLGFWVARLTDARIAFEPPSRRGDEEIIALRDPDGMRVDLVDAGAAASDDAWVRRDIPGTSAIRGFHGAGLAVGNPERSASFLSSVLGLRPAGETDGRIRLVTDGGGVGTVAEIIRSPSMQAGRMGAGAVHHIAWRATDDAAQLLLRSRVTAAGTPATAVIDRTYFHSVYFQEPGSILFEIATDPPGFSVDEPAGELGTALKLPRWLEESRAEIERSLPPLETAQDEPGAQAWTQAV